jgi:hypothetical protein
MPSRCISRMVRTSTRRRLLAVAGVGLAGVAGCGEPAEDGDEEDGGEDDDGDGAEGDDGEGEEDGGYSLAIDRRDTPRNG